jgi:phosphomannomutase/phosphoglucomutase
MNSEIFREYDIRGIAGKDMTKDDVIQIGKGVGIYLIQHGSSKLIIIAYF